MKKEIITIFFIAFFLLPHAVLAEEFTMEDAKALTLKARGLVEREGIEKARPLLHDLHGEYRKGEKGELYISVINWDGVWLAYPPRPEGVGKSVLNVKDSDGKYLVKEMIEIAKTKGEGWFEYRWLDPSTGKIRLKNAYVARVQGQDMYVSAGVYK